MCDCLVALPPASEDGVARFAKNSDRPVGERQVVEWHAAERVVGPVRATYIDVDLPVDDTVGVLGSRPEWMWGFEHGVNEAKVAVGNETIYTTLDPRAFPPALTGMDLVRLALLTSTSAAGAVDAITSLLERYGQGGSGHRDRDRPYWSSFLVADPSDAFVVETSGRDFAVEKVERTRAISNRTTIPSFDAAHRHPKQPVETLVDPRLDASRAVLDTPEPVSADALKAHLRSHVGGPDGWTVCMHAGEVEATTASIVADLAGDDRPALARMLLGSPCESMYVPIVVGRPLDAPVTHRPRDDELEAELERGATALR